MYGILRQDFLLGYVVCVSIKEKSIWFISKKLKRVFALPIKKWVMVVEGVRREIEGSLPTNLPPFMCKKYYITLADGEHPFPIVNGPPLEQVPRELMLWTKNARLRMCNICPNIHLWKMPLQYRTNYSDKLLAHVTCAQHIRHHHLPNYQGPHRLV